jgi:hypothetical protein
MKTLKGYTIRGTFRIPTDRELLLLGILLTEVDKNHNVHKISPLPGNKTRYDEEEPIVQFLF